MIYFKNIFCKHDFIILNINRNHGYNGILDYDDFDWIRTEVCVICKKCGKKKSFFSQKTETPMHTNIHIKFRDEIEQSYNIRYKILLLKLKSEYNIDL